MVTARTILLAILLPTTAVAQTTVLHDFEPPDGIYGGPITLDRDGTIYGITQTGGAGFGTVYKLAPGNQFRVLVAFNGQNGGSPTSKLILRRRVLYGTTLGGSGTIFSVDVNGRQFATLHTFLDDGNGNQPAGTIAIGSTATIYGTTADGAVPLPPENQQGVLYSLQQDGTYTVLHRFIDETYDSPNGVVIDAAGNIFGSTSSGSPTNDQCGTIFEYQPGTGTFTTLFDMATRGCVPTLAGFDKNGDLYGFTVNYKGGYRGHWTGELFRVRNLSSGYAFKRLWVSPKQEPVLISGLTVRGIDRLVGSYGAGMGPLPSPGGSNLVTLFSFSNSSFTVLDNFTDPSDGSVPSGAPAVAPDGSIVGSTLFGGDPSCGYDGYGCGVVYSFLPPP